MAQENSNVRRCGHIGDDEDNISMVDVLNEEARLQADANAVLGDSDEYNCTYPRGYIKRQALYACATCTPEGNAGICLACSYACHEGHDIYELYTKRSFKCDCGNEKFKGHPCQLVSEGKELNSRNRYDQTFRGLYCTCSRPYPDDDDSVDDEMIQCIVCEDWYHGRHLKATIPDNSDYHEMICFGCMCKYSFLWAYHEECAVTATDETDGEDCNVDVEHLEAAEEHKKSDDLGSASPSSTSKAEKRKRDESKEGPSPKKTKTCAGNKSTDNTPTKEDGVDESSCRLKSLQHRLSDLPDKSTFWSEGWRTKLCRCNECMEMYQDRNIEFLIDSSDTMQAYEARGQEKISNAATANEADTAAFNSMGRVQQIEVVRGMVDLKTELNEFLQGFAREGKIVKESDIREFFQRMEERRRERMQLPQDNCR